MIALLKHSTRARKRRRRLIVLAVLILLGLCYVGLKATQSNRFCSSCHSVAPYAGTWVRDEAHRKVRCTQCHLEQGLPGAYTSQVRYVVQCAVAELKASENRRFAALVNDESCTQSGCHRNETWDGNPGGRSSTPLGAFRHNTHFDEILPGRHALPCTACHVGSPPSMKLKRHFHVDVRNCFPCHRIEPEGKIAHPYAVSERGCWCCHPEGDLSSRHGHPAAEGRETGTPADGLAGTMVCVDCHPMHGMPRVAVEIGQCQKCHPEAARSKDDLSITLHEIHVKARKADCSDCHEMGPHGAWEKNLLDRMDCTACHPDFRVRFLPQTEVYMGRLGGIVMPDPMAAAGVACCACHVQGEEGCSDGRASCIRCHVEGYEKLVPLWQKTIREKLARFKAQLKTALADGRLEKIPARLTRFMSQIEEDGSVGVHNIFLINQLLDQGLEKLPNHGPGGSK